MSSLAGLVDFDDKHCENSRHRLLMDVLELSHSSVDAITEPYVLMLLGDTASTSSSSERQLRHLRKKHLVSWDGRIDNRREILSIVGGSGDCTWKDVDIVSALYDKSGVNGLSRLIGDFAFAIWDLAKGSLFLGRDPFGCRPLFYSQPGTWVAWASTIRPLLSIVGQSDLDYKYACGFLTFTETPGRTPYKSLLSVEPGCVVKISRSGHSTTRNWDVVASTDLIYESDSTYEEEFLYLFRQSVDCRLRGANPVMAELSGGMDSSSIVCIADELCASANNTRGNRQIETLSYLYDGAPTADESKFINHIARKRDSSLSHQLYDHDILDSYWRGAADNVVWWRPNPFCCFFEMFSDVGRLMKDRNSRVLLSGFGGDHALMSDSPLFPVLRDMAQGWRLTGLWRHLSSIAIATGTPLISLLWDNVIFPCFSHGLRHRLLRNKIAPPWLNMRWLEDAGCIDRALDLPDTVTSYYQQEHLLILRDAVTFVSQDYYTDFEIDATYPFLHRPFVEFLLKVPMSQKTRPEENRSLQRRAMRGILPDKIRLRKSKGGPDESLYRAFERHAGWLGDLVESSRLCAIGCASKNALKKALIQARHGLPVAMAYLHRTITFETWVLHYERWLKNNSPIQPVGRRNQQRTDSSSPALSVTPHTL